MRGISSTFFDGDCGIAQPHDFLWNLPLFWIFCPFDEDDGEWNDYYEFLETSGTFYFIT